MKKLTLSKETLTTLSERQSRGVAGGGTVGYACTGPNTDTAEPTVCLVYTDQSWCNTQKCLTYRCKEA